MPSYTIRRFPPCPPRAHFSGRERPDPDPGAVDPGKGEQHPDAHHGSWHQYHDAFVAEATRFLDA
jgi:hypothetical protein